MTAKNEPKSTETPADAPASVQPQTPPQDETTTQLNKLQSDITDLTDMLKRKQAEFENYRKRMETQSNQMVAFSAQRILTKVIPIVDMFELALKHKDNVSEFMSGMEMIHGSFTQLLADENVKTPSLVGEKFDPKLARAVGTRVVPGTEAGVVVEQASNCYILNDRVIKHANVIVSAAAPSGDAASQNETK